MLKNYHCKLGSDGAHKFYQHLGESPIRASANKKSTDFFFSLLSLSYLHSCTPPIIHGNLTCDTIFIQHNGLVKIGSVAPDAINHHVKTCRENIKNMHFIAPEYGAGAVNAIASSLTPAIDIFSFGMCALEMAALEIQGNGDSGTMVTPENIQRTIESLEDKQQKDFISKCLSHDPAERPSAKELLFHPLLFEVHSLKLLVAHCLLNTARKISHSTPFFFSFIKSIVESRAV